MSSLLAGGCCCDAPAQCLCKPDDDGSSPFEYGTPPLVRARVSYNYSHTGASSPSQGSDTVETSPFVLTALPGSCQNATSATFASQIGQNALMYLDGTGPSAGFSNNGAFWDPIAQAYVTPPFVHGSNPQRSLTVRLQLGPANADGSNQTLLAFLRRVGTGGPALDYGAAWNVSLPEIGTPTVTANGSGMHFARASGSSRQMTLFGSTPAAGSYYEVAWTVSAVSTVIGPRHIHYRGKVTGAYTPQGGGPKLGDVVIGMDIEIDGNCEMAP